MININFDNPYLLLLAIPLLAAVLVPYCIAIRKENRSKSVVASFILHLIMVVLVTLASAGLHFTAIVTKTEVYVLADVSYSANRNLSLVEDHVRAVENALPDNSKMSVIAFGRDCKTITPLGGKFQGVQDAGVDDSATDIKGALEYAGSLFSEGVIKRIVLITDGKQTDADGAAGLVNVIERLYEEKVLIDAIYLNNNIPETAKEAQVTSVEYTHSTYFGHSEKAEVLLQSNQDGVHSTLTLYQGEEAIATEYLTLKKGYTLTEFTLPTDVDGTFSYKVVLTTENGDDGETDELAINNTRSFTQTVVKQTKVLLLHSVTQDKGRFQSLYGEDVLVDAYEQKTNTLYNPPFTLEQLIEYDEIVLSNVDVSSSDFRNSKTFLKNLDIAVSQYGKSLTTIGDTNIQNQKDNTLKTLEDMLPVKFGNREQDPKLMAIVIDTSRSMQNASRLQIAKAAAKEALNLLNDQDYVAVISFSGSVAEVWPSSPVGNSREKIAAEIDKIPPTQGTVIGAAMAKAKEVLDRSSLEEKEVMLISDGESYTHETDDPVAITKSLKDVGVHTWVINTNNNVGATALKNIASAGQLVKVNNYFKIDSEENVSEIMLGKVADVVTESLIEDKSGIPVGIKEGEEADEVLSGVENFPSVRSYVYAKAKPSATTVLYATYTKASGTTTQAPIYSYWNYGTGKVSCLTTSIRGSVTTETNFWTGNEDAEQFVKNVYTTNLPKKHHNMPFTETITYDGQNLQMEFVPATLDFTSVVSAEITAPNGETSTHRFLFDSQKYTCAAEMSECGKYEIKLVYEFGTLTYEKTLTYDLDYKPEHNCFTVYSVSDLYKAIRTRGTIYTDGNISLENDTDDVVMYIVYCVVPFMAICAAIIVADIIIRKLRWVDIQNLFGNREIKKKGGKNE